MGTALRAKVSANYSAVLGACTIMGRWFTREDQPEDVISYHAWQQLFHGSPLDARMQAQGSSVPALHPLVLLDRLITHATPQRRHIGNVMVQTDSPHP